VVRFSDGYCFLGIEVTDHGKAIEQPLTDPISTALDCVIQLAEKWANPYATVSVGLGPL
jgi:hypothetical protein